MDGSQPQQHILINGAGLAGLALALALAKRNIASTLFEIRSEPQTIGGAILLAPNALRVLDKTIGVAETIRKVGYEFDKFQLIAEDGLELGTVVNGDKEKFGYHALRVRRVAIHDALLDLTKEYPNLISIRFDETIEKIEETQSGVTAILHNGQSVQGSLVVGADGIHSKIRSHVLGDKAPTPEYSGMFGVGGLVKRSDVQWGSCRPPAMVFSKRGTLIATPIDPDGQTVAWGIQRTIDERTREGWHDYIVSGQALKDACSEFGESPSQTIQDVLAKTLPDSIRGWPPYSLPDLPTWHTERVVLIGDAAHAIPPYAGQGAAQAFEDAGLLARLLSEPEGLEKGYRAALAHFEQLRKKRFAMVRELTVKSGSSRTSTTSTFGWLLKKYTMWAYLHVVGSALPSEELYNYDVNKEKLSS